MNLEQINSELDSVATDLSTKVRQLAQVEYTYEKRFADLIVHSGMATALMKESEAKLVLETEGLWEPLVTLRGEVRALYHMKDCLIAVSANLRSLNHHIEVEHS